MTHSDRLPLRSDRLTVGAGALIAVLALGVALTLHNTQRLSAGGDAVAHTYEVMDAVADLRGRVRELEALQRTFVIVGSEGIPTELTDLLTIARTELQELRELVRDNAAQMKRLSVAERQLDGLGEKLLRTARVRVDAGFDAARVIVQQGESRDLAGKLAATLLEMKSDEKRLLQSRLVERDRSFRWALLVGLLSGLAGIGGFLALIFSTRRRVDEGLVAAAEIAGHRERLATIVDSSNDAIISKSLDGMIRSWNAAAERLLGFTSQEAVGQSISIILPPDGHVEEVALVERLRRGERIEHYETTRIAKDGRPVEVSLTLSPVNDGGGRISGASTIIRDIRDRKSAENSLRDSEERFRTLADNMSQFAWMADPQGALFWYNRRWYDYTGTTFEEMQGWGWRKVHHPDHVDRVVKRVQRSWDTGEDWEDLFPLRSKTGEYRWFLSRAVPIRDAAGKVIRWLGTNTDVTEQREAEEALKDADRRKNEFLAMLAHELRNPLAPIRNGLELLEREERYNEESAELMRQQVEKLVHMVDDLLDVSRIMRGKVELHKAPLEISTFLRQTIKTTESVIARRGQTLLVEAPADEIWLNADSLRLAQVIDNLLVNASKYSDASTTIRLTVERDDGQVKIAVADQGIGIEPALLPSVFDLFAQADRTLDRSQGGLGIGLTVVREIVELHGGRAEAFSEGMDRGSTFVVTLPVDDTAKQAAARAAESRSRPLDGKAQLRVLVVDDNVGAAWMLSKLLSKIGDHQVDSAHDGPSAISKILQAPPDVVFLDIGLPGMDGFEVARRLRSHAELNGLRIIALTGYGQEEDRRRSEEAGFDAHLVKPANIDDIEALFATISSERAQNN